MYSVYRVIGSSEAAKPLIVGKDTVYVHTNIIRIEEGEDEGLYQYDEVQYSYDEYMKLMIEQQQTDAETIKTLQSENAKLAGDLDSTQLALLDLYQQMKQGGIVNG